MAGQGLRGTEDAGKKKGGVTSQMQRKQDVQEERQQPQATWQD